MCISGVYIWYIRLRLRNHLFRQRLHRMEYYKEECTDVSWRFLLRPLGVAIIVSQKPPFGMQKYTLISNQKERYINNICFTIIELFSFKILS